MVEGNMDFRGHLEVMGSEDGPEAETHRGPMRTPGGNGEVSGSNSGLQETESE